MTKAHSKLCGLVRRQSSSEEEWLSSPKEKKDNRVANRKDHCESRRQSHNNHQPHPAPLLSQVKNTQSQSSHIDYPPHHSELLKPSKSTKSWPPEGYQKNQSLPPPKAYELIVAGAPFFHGHKLQINFGGKQYYHLFSTHSTYSFRNSDSREDKILEAASFRLHGPGPPIYPWETLEQPSMAFFFGSISGTVTLNHWVNMSSRVYKTKKRAYVLDVKPRELTFASIVERLIYFEKGSQEDDTDASCNIPCQNIPRLSELFLGPQKIIENEIQDLIKILSRRTWIDFSRKENHVVAKFFANMLYADKRRQKLFFYQLLLALELEFRIQGHNIETRIEILRSLPEKLKWDLAIAKTWRSNIKIENIETTNHHNRVHFVLLNKRQQLKKLFEFAQNLKWPSLSSLESFSFDSIGDLDSYSLDTVSYLTAVTLPGPSLPFLLMNALIDIDPASVDLGKIIHFFPNIGFQYRDVTYWNSNCIVGKVLAPTCKEVGGWIGPALPAASFDQTQIVRIHQRKPKQQLEVEDVETLFERSLPLGPKAEKYPIKDYNLLKPNYRHNSIVDNIRIELLSLCLITSIEEENQKPKTFDASIQFTVNGKSWPLILKYDVTFVSSCSCKGGPHPIFFDYEHQIVRIDDLVDFDWKNSGFTVDSNSKIFTGNPLDTTASGRIASEYAKTLGVGEDSNISITEYNEKVLVIEAYGVVDNEVLARAWCAYWGLSGLIADIQNTCMGCAIRESFAACVNILILIDSAMITNGGD